MSILERCPSYKESKKRSKERQGPNSKCPFYRGVHLIEVSVKRESTVLHFNHSVVQSSASFLGTDSLRKQPFLLAPHHWRHFENRREKPLFLQANGLKLCDLE